MDRVARMCHERLPAAWLSLSPLLRQRPTSLAVTLGRRAEQRVLRRGGIPSGRCSRIQGRVGNSRQALLARSADPPAPRHPVRAHATVILGGPCSADHRVPQRVSASIRLHSAPFLATFTISQRHQPLVAWLDETFLKKIKYCRKPVGSAFSTTSVQPQEQLRNF